MYTDDVKKKIQACIFRKRRFKTLSVSCTEKCQFVCWYISL